jgi:hypothetical protein
MKIFLAILLLFPVIMFAQQGTYRDRYGDIRGSYQDRGDQRDYRNQSGDYAGSATRRGNVTDYRDEYGDYVGSEERWGEEE